MLLKIWIYISNFVANDLWYYPNKTSMLFALTFEMVHIFVIKSFHEVWFKWSFQLWWYSKAHRKTYLSRHKNSHGGQVIVRFAMSIKVNFAFPSLMPIPIATLVMISSFEALTLFRKLSMINSWHLNTALQYVWSLIFWILAPYFFL